MLAAFNAFVVIVCINDCQMRKQAFLMERFLAKFICNNCSVIHDARWSIAGFSNEMISVLLGRFVSRHTSINEEEEKMSTNDSHFSPSPPLLLRQITSPVASQPVSILHEDTPPSPDIKTPLGLEETDGPRGGMAAGDGGQRKAVKRSPLYGEIIVLG